MSIISLNVDQLKSVSSEIEALDNTLVNNYLPDLESELDAIRGNVQGEELNSILNSISSQFAGVKTTLSQALPKLETFLQEQIKSYGVTEEQLKADLSAVLNKMAAYSEENQSIVSKAADAAVAAVTGITGAVDAVWNSKKESADTKETPKTESAPKQEEKPKTESAPKQENKGGFINDVKENFNYNFEGKNEVEKVTHAVTKTITGVGATVVDGIQAVGSGAMSLIGKGLSGIGSLFSGLGNATKN